MRRLAVGQDAVSRRKTDHRRTIRTSHWRACVRLLLAVIMILSGAGLTQHPGSPGVSPQYWDVVGFVTIAAFGILSVLYAPALVVPDRLIIDDDGFTLRTFWRGDRHFSWAHIKSVRADWNLVSQPHFFVWWYYCEGSPCRTAPRPRARHASKHLVVVDACHADREGDGAGAHPLSTAHKGEGWPLNGGMTVETDPRSVADDRRFQRPVLPKAAKRLSGSLITLAHDRS